MQDSAIYRFNRECILTKCTGDDAMNRDEANFILPEINKLSAEVKSGSLSILFVSCGMLFLLIHNFTLVGMVFAYFMLCCCFVAELFKERLDEPLFPGELLYVG